MANRTKNKTHSLLTIEKALIDFTDCLNVGEPVDAVVYMTSMIEDDYEEFKRLARTVLWIYRNL